MVGTFVARATSWFANELEVATDHGTERVLTSSADLHETADARSRVIRRASTGSHVAVYAPSPDYEGWLLACDLASGELGFMRVDQLATASHGDRC